MKAKQFFYVMAALLGLSILSIIGAYYWGNQQLQAKSAVISDLAADRDIAQEKILRLRQAKQDAEEINDVSALLDRLLPNQKNQDTLVADIIYTATSEAGISFSQVTSFSFSGATNDPDDLSGTLKSKDYAGVYEYPFSLQIEKISYPTLIGLLREIESNGRIVQVANIQISPDSETLGLLNVTLSTKAYVRP